MIGDQDVSIMINMSRSLLKKNGFNDLQSFRILQINHHVDSVTVKMVEQNAYGRATFSNYIQEP